MGGASLTCQIEHQNEHAECHEQSEDLAASCDRVLRRMNSVIVLHRSDRHDPDGIEQEPEEKAIHRKPEHDSFPC